MGLFKKFTEMAGGVDSDLLANGLLGRGIIVGAQMTGAAVSFGPDEYRVCDLQVQVFLDGQQPYIAQCRQRVPEYLLASLGQGAMAAVRVDPANLATIAVDFQLQPPVVTIAAPADGGAEAVLASGTAAEGVIVAAMPLGVRNYLGHDVQIMTVTITVPGQVPYQAQAGNPVPPMALPLVFPGSKVPVKVNLAEGPNAFAIDWDAALAAS